MRSRSFGQRARPMDPGDKVEERQADANEAKRPEQGIREHVCTRHTRDHPAIIGVAILRAGAATAPGSSTGWHRRFLSAESRGRKGQSGRWTTVGAPAPSLQGGGAAAEGAQEALGGSQAAAAGGRGAGGHATRAQEAGDSGHTATEAAIEAASGGQGQGGECVQVWTKAHARWIGVR